MMQPKPKTRRRHLSIKGLPTLIVTAIILVSFSTLVHLMTEAWWFDALNFSSIFRTLIIWRSIAWSSTFLIFGLFLWVNYRVAMDVTRYSPFRFLEDNDASQTRTLPNYAVGIVIFSIALAAAQTSVGAWETILKYLNASDFGSVDPIYQRDIGFYIFQLPLYEGLHQWFFALFGSALALCIPIYVLKGSIDLGRGWRNLIIGQAKNHLSLLLAAIALLITLGFWLQQYNLLYSETGVVFGAGYTDLHAKLVALRVMSPIALALTVLLVFSIKRNGIALPVYGISLFFIAWIGFQMIYPALEQQFSVEPNELAKERPYIAHNIALTRQAYGIDRIQNRPFAVETKLTRQVLQDNETTIHNIRLWDYRPLLSTYRQLQEIRLYYKFKDVDIDRYTFNGNYQQVMLSPRELAYSQVPQQAQTWVNQRLKYTHGYGLAMSPVNRVTPQGLPEFLIKDVPPVSQVKLPITQPRVYYGEETNTYIFTGTSTDEFDYPQGDANASNRYDGGGGVPIPSIWQRLAYAYDLRSFQILFSNYLTQNSRIHYDRAILQRVSKVVPFLRLDSDPYLTVIDGKLQWIIDAYTVSDRYPYSEPLAKIKDAQAVLKGGKNFNYIRNSVKILVDAYDGTMQFFAVDETDPLLATYRKIFPDLFKSGQTIPAQVKTHFRYPIDLFKIQAQINLAYHMTDAEVFYNQEDLWRFSKQVYEGNEEIVEPYYVIMRLPEQEQEEFALILPFTPVNKDNMVAWMVARSDGENYGKLAVYEFPKQELIYGPKQIEARIDQNPQISQQLTLWNQQGSKVLRGNLLVIPIQKSLLYVEPLYLKADNGELPELKRVIVAYGEQIVMEETLENALATIFGNQQPTSVAGRRNTPSPLSQSALATYRKAKQAAQAGNWTEYGRSLQELETTLQQLNQNP